MAVARIETAGLSVDRSALAYLSCTWPELQASLIAEIDSCFGCYRGGQFQIEAFQDWLANRGIDWPRNVIGGLDLSDGAFKEGARAYPELRSLKELRATLDTFQPDQIQVGRDGRNRVRVRPFASRTGRNQPSTKASILGGPSWTRFIVRPERGRGLALIDWSQQEFGIAAALSEDTAIQMAYRAGDPYTAFAIAAGAAPKGATARTHPSERAQFKACALGVQYGMGTRTLARMLDMPFAAAASLLERHKRIYPRFWQWSDDIEAERLLRGQLRSVFGWKVAVGARCEPPVSAELPDAG